MEMVLFMERVKNVFAARPLIVGVALLLSACAYSPNEYSTDYPLPEEFNQNDTEQKLVVDADWWLQFDSQILNGLMQVLEDQNLTLDTARLRLERARLQVIQAEADDLPSVGGRVGANSGRDLDTSQQRSSSSGSLSVSYEVDIWGSRDASQLASRLNVDSTQFALRSAALQVQSILADEYFTLLSLLQRQTIAQQNLDSSQKLLDLIKLRFDAGSASGIEVAQQRNTLLSSQSALVSINNAIKLSQRIIAVLCGDNRMQKIETSETLQILTLPEVDLIQPAVILAQRPDVGVAKANLQLADIDLYQASIAGLPGLNFGADLSVSDLLDLANGWSIGAALSSAATLFDNGKIRAAEDIADIDVQIALNDMKSVTLSATQELLDGLDNLAYFREVNRLDKLQLANNKELYELAQIRYNSGDTDFLTLLNAQRSWFTAQLTLVNSYRLVLAATIDVYRAAGGVPSIVNDE